MWILNHASGLMSLGKRYNESFTVVLKFAANSAEQFKILSMKTWKLGFILEQTEQGD